MSDSIDTISPCPASSLIEAFHDGELRPGERMVVERHLATCADCTAVLERARSLSQLFVGMSGPELSSIAVHRLHRRLSAVAEGGLLRLAWTISGIAAAVLLAGSVWLAMTSKENVPVAEARVVQSAPPWIGITAAVLESDSPTHDPATPAAQWYLADATQQQQNDTP